MLLVDLKRRGQKALHYDRVRPKVQQHAAGDHALDQR